MSGPLVSRGEVAGGHSWMKVGGPSEWPGEVNCSESSKSR